MGFWPALLDLLGEVKRLTDSSCSSHNQNHPWQKNSRDSELFYFGRRGDGQAAAPGWESDVRNVPMVDQKAEQCDSGLKRTIEHCIRDRTCVSHRDVFRGANAVLIPNYSSTQIRKTRKIPVVMETVSVLRQYPHCDRLLRSRRQVNWRKSQFPFCISQLFHTDPASTSSGHHPFSIFLGCAHQSVRPRLS